MDRFYAVENPRRSEAGFFVLHTIKPKCLIECAEPEVQPISSGLPHQIFTYVNSDGFEKTWALIVRDIYDDSSLEEVEKLLARAWRWYRSYMEWEDRSIDEDDEERRRASLN